jgi:hypothetical protein
MFKLSVKYVAIFWLVFAGGVLLAAQIGESTRGDISGRMARVATQRSVMRFTDATTGVELTMRPPVGAIQRISMSPDMRRALLYASNDNLQMQVFFVFELSTRRLSESSIPIQNHGDLFIERQMEEFAPKWSPDSHFVMYINPNGGGISVIDYTQGVTRHIDTSALPLIGAEWAADGREIQVSSYEGTFIADAIEGALHPVDGG